MIGFSNAKINIGLNIIHKMPNGYHTIESVFYPTNFCDALEILPADAHSFTTSGIDIPVATKPNLCQQAYDLLHTAYNLPPVAMHLHKNIPIGAGLGGGSANAATTLTMLNDIFDLRLTQPQLCHYAAQLGSDCPFFIHNKPAYLYGAGKEITPFDIHFQNYFLVIIHPNIHINTTQAYQNCVPATPDYDLKKTVLQPINTWKNTLKNDFEPSVFAQFKSIEKIKNDLYNHGALYASMSGSGSAVFGVFDALPNNLKAQFKGYNYYEGELG